MANKITLALNMFEEAKGRGTTISGIIVKPGDTIEVKITGTADSPAISHGGAHPVQVYQTPVKRSWADLEKIVLHEASAQADLGACWLMSYDEVENDD